MYRAKYHMYAKTFDELDRALAECSEYNKLAATLGWVQGTFWLQAVGDPYEIVAEFDYPDLTTFEKESQGSPETEKLFRSQGGDLGPLTPFELLVQAELPG
jgi:hypothetical protein